MTTSGAGRLAMPDVLQLPQEKIHVLTPKFRIFDRGRSLERMIAPDRSFHAPLECDEEPVPANRKQPGVSAAG